MDARKYQLKIWTQSPFTVLWQYEFGCQLTILLGILRDSDFQDAFGTERNERMCTLY